MKGFIKLMEIIQYLVLLKKPSCWRSAFHKVCIEFDNQKQNPALKYTEIKLSLHVTNQRVLRTKTYIKLEQAPITIKFPPLNKNIVACYRKPAVVFFLISPSKFLLKLATETRQYLDVRKWGNSRPGQRRRAQNPFYLWSCTLLNSLISIRENSARNLVELGSPALIWEHKNMINLQIAQIFAATNKSWMYELLESNGHHKALPRCTLFYTTECFHFKGACTWRFSIVHLPTIEPLRCSCVPLSPNRGIQSSVHIVPHQLHTMHFECRIAISSNISYPSYLF